MTSAPASAQCSARCSRIPVLFDKAALDGRTQDFMNITNSSFKSATRGFLKYACMFVVAAASQAVAQQVTVSLGSGSAVPGGTVDVDVSLVSSGGASPAAVQWTMSYSSSAVIDVSVVTGSGPRTKGKSVTCSSTSGATTCLLFGMN